mmetsp:Transcript_2422/g.6293  ORF Transcript_2422/g.6293 Transcript_2422/m.6293 type:complete len:572 (-) Transcript_2422:128-1843(-)
MARHTPQSAATTTPTRMPSASAADICAVFTQSDVRHCAIRSTGRMSRSTKQRASDSSSSSTSHVRSTVPPMTRSGITARIASSYMPSEQLTSSHAPCDSCSVKTQPTAVHSSGPPSAPTFARSSSSSGATIRWHVPSAAPGSRLHTREMTSGAMPSGSCCRSHESAFESVPWWKTKSPSRHCSGSSSQSWLASEDVLSPSLSPSLVGAELGSSAAQARSAAHAVHSLPDQPSAQPHAQPSGVATWLRPHTRFEGSPHPLTCTTAPGEKGAVAQPRSTSKRTSAPGCCAGIVHAIDDSSMTTSPVQLSPVLVRTVNGGPPSIDDGGGIDASVPSWRPVMVTRTSSPYSAAPGSALESRSGAYVSQVGPTKLHLVHLHTLPPSGPPRVHVPCRPHGGSQMGWRAMTDPVTVTALSLIEPASTGNEAKMSVISSSIPPLPVASGTKLPLRSACACEPARSKTLLPMCASPDASVTSGEMRMPSGPRWDMRVGPNARLEPVSRILTTAALSFTSGGTSVRLLAEICTSAEFHSSGVLGHPPSAETTMVPSTRGGSPSSRWMSTTLESTPPSLRTD